MQDGPPAGRRVGYVEVLRVPQFQALFVAQLLSLLGDRAAAVALAVLVYDRTQSPTLAAAVFALTFLPHLFAAPLATLVDRLPRRSVLVGCDLVRIPLLLAMLVPGLPLPVLLALLGAVTLFEVPFDAAQVVVSRAVLDDDQYPVGVALASALHQVSLLAGSVGGGLLIAALSVRGCLLVDAATFGLSAALVRLRLAPHRPDRHACAPEHDEGGLGPTLRLLLASGPRRMVLLAFVVSVVVVAPEGLAVSYAAELGGGAALTGVLLAAVPAGSALGALLVARLLTAPQQQRAAVPVCLTSMLGLLALQTGPGPVGAVLLWTVVGTGGAMIVIASPAVMAAVPESHHGRAFGLLSSGLQAVQALGVVAAGLLAAAVPVSTALALLGGTGLLLLVPLAGIRRPQPGGRTTRTAWSRATTT